jgi:hypothetical protein
MQLSTTRMYLILFRDLREDNGWYIFAGNYNYMFQSICLLFMLIVNYIFHTNTKKKQYT